MLKNSWERNFLCGFRCYISWEPEPPEKTGVRQKGGRQRQIKRDRWTERVITLWKVFVYVSGGRARGRETWKTERQERRV